MCEVVRAPATRNMAYCTAGHPPALLHSGGTLRELEVDGPAVGMVPELPYGTHTITIGEAARLLVYSDGVFEIEKPDGQMWQYGEFVERITGQMGTDSDLIERHLQFVRELHAGDVLGDDFSMVEVRF